MTVARLEQEMPSHEFTEWMVRDRLDDEDAEERARQERMEELASGRLAGRGGRRVPPVIGG